MSSSISEQAISFMNNKQLTNLICQLPILYSTASFTFSATSSSTQLVQRSSCSSIHHSAASSGKASFSSIYLSASSVKSLFVSYWLKNSTTSGTWLGKSL